MADPRPLLQGEALKEAARTLAAELQAKVQDRQQGVGTFCDHALGDLLAKLEQLDQAAPWEDSVAQLSEGLDELRGALRRLQLLLARRSQGRFVDFHDRFQPAQNGMNRNCDLSYLDFVLGQGAFECMQWKGLPLFKTAYDFSIYSMMLWALKPQTIIELGSGTGASAVWLADLGAAFGTAGTIHSVDLYPPELQHERVRFIQGDCRDVNAIFDRAFLETAAHPWLLIEDAHVNVLGILTHFHPHLRPGDYAVVEDSAGKQREISRFLTDAPDCYKVDTYYTDFFGRNVTCAQDSIFVRT